MRRTLILGPAAALLLALGAAAPAAAHNAGPCNETGGPGHSDYAQHHIVPAAQAGMLGNGGHKPGEHRGYSACL
jgi:hypothetical protein